MRSVMTNAIADAGLGLDDIHYINAHGTGTIANDRLEATAIREVFGARADHLPVSSTKSQIGHAMGASGALEFLATLAALEAQIAPPTLNFQEPDPACPIDPVAEGPRKVAMTHALSNSFAFGGLNVTLAAARAGTRS
jgi:nodulation protein E